MAKRSEDAGGRLEVPPRRPLWVAALAAALTAVFAALFSVIVVDAYYNSRIPLVCGHCIRSPDPLTLEWWAYVAPFFPYIAFVAVVYAVSLLAMMAYLGHRPNPPRLPWPLAGLLAMVPLACIWIARLISMPPYDPVMALTIPFLWMAFIGLIGGWVAGAVRRDRRV